MFYWFVRALCLFILAVFRRWEVYGAENLPQEGPVVVASNHVSYWDPVAVGCALNRKVFFMAKWELFEVPVLSPVISRLGAFPVKRKSKDGNAINVAVQLLKAGNVVGIFPEGTRSRTKKLLPPHSGMIILAHKANAAILPVAVEGTRKNWGKVKVYVGKPLAMKDFGDIDEKIDKKDLGELSAIVMREIKNLLES